MPTQHSADNGRSLAHGPAGRLAPSRGGTLRPPVRRRVTAGFTIVEMVVVLAIVGILAGVAAPAVMNMVRDNSIISASNLLTASLNYARNQALIQHVPVRLCKSIDGATCDTTTGTTGYSKGWLVYADIDSSGTYNTGDTLLKAVAPSSNNKITINGSGGTNSIKLNVPFTPLGMLLTSTSSTTGATTSGSSYIVLCDDRGWAYGGQYARVIAISTTGRISTASGNKQGDIGLNGSAAASTCTPS